MGVVAEFRALSVPRISFSENDFRGYDAILAQRALWDVLIFQMVRKHRVTVELRYGSHDFATPGFVTLRLHGTASKELAQDMRQVHALLPGEYQWTSSEGRSLGAERRVWIARILRRVEYLDLPAASLAVLRSGVLSPTLGAVPQSGDSAPGFQASFTGGGLRMGFRVVDAGQVRDLPLPETTFAELQAKQFCLPIPGSITSDRIRLKALFQGIQRAGSAVVSVCLHPMDDADRRRIQSVALNFQHFLDPFSEAITTSGFADSSTVRTAFSRLSLPSGYVFYLTLRVAADTPEAAVGVANLVAESNGGAIGFRVIPPTREVFSNALHDSFLDIRGPAWSESRVQVDLNSLKAELDASGVSMPEDPDLTDFLSRFPHLYSIGEAQSILPLPISDDEGLAGLETQLVPPFAVPSLNFLQVHDKEDKLLPPPADRIRIGMIQRAGPRIDSESLNRFANYAWHSIDPIDLTKHALIVGSTGSGKTMTTLFLVRELARLGVPLMVIEPVKTEYFDKLKGLVPHLIRFRLEGDGGKRAKDYLGFDPLRVPAGITVARHCSYVKSCFEASFSLPEFLALLLENGLRSYYEAPASAGGCGLTKFSRGGPGIKRIEGDRVYPSFHTFRTYFIDTFLKTELQSMAASRFSGDAALNIDAFRRRFANLGDGVIGEVFRHADEFYIAQGGHPDAYDLFDLYLKQNVIIELDAVPDADHKALLMSFLLSKLFERRQAEDFLSRQGELKVPPGLRHFLIVEEAHRLLSTSASASMRSKETTGDSAKSKAVQLFVDMLAEVRAFGQGLAIVEQIPTKIVPEAVKNTNLKIMLRLTAKDDREYLGEAMNFTEAQMRFVTNLKVERGRQINFVVFEEGVEQPLLLSLPLPQVGSVSSVDPYGNLFAT